MAEALPPTSPTAVTELLGSGAFTGDQALGGTTHNVTGDLGTFMGGPTGKAGATPCLNSDGTHKGNTYLVGAGSTHLPLTLPPTTGNGWTRIKSNSGSLPARGTKILTTDTAKLFRIQATASPHTCVTLPQGSAGWQFIGLDADSTAVIGPGDLGGDSLLWLAGSRFIAERCYLHANPLTTNFARGVLWMGSDLQLWDTWLQPAGRVKAAGESQAIFFRGIGGARGHIENVELIAHGENIMFNDQYSTVPTTDVVFKRCHFWKNKTLWQKWVNDGGVTLNPSWDGNMWVIKNLFESKWAYRVLVDGCTFENCWPQIESGTSGEVSAGQDGTAIQILGGHASEDPGSGSGQFLHNDDFLFSNCEIVNASAAFGCTTSNGTMGYSGADPTVVPNARIHFVNILARGVGMRGAFFNHAGIDHKIDHFSAVPMDGTTNTPSWGGPRVSLLMTADTPGSSWPRVTIKRAVWGGSSFGIRIEGPGGAIAVTTANLNTLFGTPGTPTGREMAENVEFGFGGTGPTGFTYLANAAAAGINTTTGVLTGGSPLKVGQSLGGSDGFDIGVKFPELVAAQTGNSVPDSQFTLAQPAAGLLVNFTNTSSGAPFTAHAWTLFATNGTTVLSTATTANHSFTYPAPGQYNVRHQVSNAQGAGTIVNVAIQVNPIATTPTLTITGPTASATLAVSSPTITLTGTSTDMTSGTWVNDRGGSGVLTGTNPWSTPVITLLEGANVLTILPTNAGVNGTADILTVTYTPAAPIPGDPPVYQAQGAQVFGVGALSAAWPAHQTGDIALLFVETANEVMATPSGGWALVLNAPQGVGTAGAAAATRLTPFWKRAAGPSEAAATIADSGDHQVAQILTFRSCIATGDPWDVTAGDVLGTASGTVTFPNVTTTVPNALIVAAYSFDTAAVDPGVNSNWDTMAGLGSAQRRTLAGTTTGTGGGFAVGTGLKVAAGATSGLITGQDTAAIQARMTIALRGVPAGTVVPPTITSLLVTSGNPATSVAYQITAVIANAANRVGFVVDGAAEVFRTVAPYQAFAAPLLLGPTPSPHVIVANVYETAGATIADTKTLNVTEPPAASGSWLVEAEADRVETATIYKLDVDGGATLVTVPQPTTGNPTFSFPFVGADRDIEVGIIPVLPSGDGPRSVFRPRRYTDPSATAPEGLKEISRAYNTGANLWTVVFRVNRKPSPALSYDLGLDGSLVHNVLQPASGSVTFPAVTFTGTNVTKTIYVCARYTAGEGPRLGASFSYVAPATQLVTGFQERSRTFTP